MALGVAPSARRAPRRDSQLASTRFSAVRCGAVRFSRSQVAAPSATATRSPSLSLLFLRSRRARRAEKKQESQAEAGARLKLNSSPVCPEGTFLFPPPAHLLFLPSLVAPLYYILHCQFFLSAKKYAVAAAGADKRPEKMKRHGEFLSRAGQRSA